MRYLSFLFILTLSITLLTSSCSDNNTKPANKCSAQYVNGVCANSDELCNNGICVKKEIECVPECSEDQVCIEGNCLQGTKEVDCIENTPDNATSTIAKVIIKWDLNAKKWETAPDCIWTCNVDYIKNSDGTACILDEGNSCDNIQCRDNSTCNEGICICNDGYQDIANEECVDIDECANGSAGCSQNCENTGGSFICSCKDGFTLNEDGKTCDDTNECETNADNCDENSTCNNLPGTFECICNSGYEKINGICTLIQACEPNPCIATNKTICKDENHDGVAECSCDEGYRDNGNGVCLDINECAEDNTCSVNANCINNPGSYECVCKSGFSGNGEICIDIDECLDSNGGCNQHCTNSVGSYTCSCDEGYVLNSDGKTCNDINECASNNGGCSQICTNTDGGFECSCNEGYELNSNGKVCDDINECLINNGGCDVNANCINPLGADNTCVCKSGYEGNGLTCTVVQICLDNPCTQENKTVCKDENSDGVAECHCDPGYKDDGNGNCIDINECILGTDTCSDNATCTNTIGSFTCTCNSGYTGNGNTCNDVNECTANTDDCAQNCTNTVGGFTCSCNSGYILNADGKTCNDVNECTLGTDTCSDNATCTNTIGSFTCACNSGYTGDGYTCSNGDDCSPNPCVHGTCTDGLNTYTCACATGWTGTNCDIDINECTLGTDTCSDNATCTNTTGSFTCACNSGYAGDGYTCADINECLTDNGGCGSPTAYLCINNIGAAPACTCNTGYQDNDTDGTCLPNCLTASLTCNHGTCNDTLGEAICICETGYIGAECLSCATGFHEVTGTCVADSCGDGFVTGSEICDYANPSTWESSCNAVFGEGYQGVINCDTCIEENIDDCYQSIVINEVMTGNGTGWIEIYNRGTADVDISGWHLDTYNHSFIIGAGVSIPADGYYFINSLNIELEDIVEITDSSSIQVDYIDWTGNKTLYGRFPNGTGAFQDLSIPTPSDANVSMKPIDIVWCDIVSPLGYTEDINVAKTIYGQIYGEIDGSKQTGLGTDNAQIRAQACYDNNGTEVCKTAVYNPACAACGNNNEYMTDVSIPTEGNHQYYYKFSGDMGFTWTKCTDVGGNEYTATIEDPNASIAINGDFETWINGTEPDSWTTIDSGISTAKEETIIRNGTASLAMTVNTSNQSDTDFRETIPVTNGVNYDVSVWVYHPAGSNIRARLFYAGNYSNFYSDPTNSGVWQELTASFVANGDTVEIGLRFYSGDGTIVYIDDFTVSPQ